MQPQMGGRGAKRVKQHEAQLGDLVCFPIALRAHVEL